MKNLYLLAALAVTLAGCDAIQKQTLKGTYRNVETRGGLWRIVDHLEVTDTKFIFATSMGEQATDYKVEDGYVYAGPEAAQVRFKIVSADTLRNEGTVGYEGTYVKVK
jgi:hypothetical protein